MGNRLVGAVVAGGVAAGLFAVPATADPINAKNTTVITLFCDNSQTPYQVVVNGNGQFTPAHVLGSNAVFVPVAFGEITGTAVPSGAPAFVAPPTTKGQSASGHKNLTTCSFQTSFPVTPDEVQQAGLPAGTTSIETIGTVTGFFTGAH